MEAVEPNYVVGALLIPDDPYYSSSGSWGQSFDDLWGLKKINSAQAWDQTVGSSLIVVADIDTGVDRNHEDLAGQIWTNDAEIPNNGADDDANGFIDDYYGWDWVNDDNDPMDDHGHGTHTVGTIAAVGNNAKGVVGVNWASKIMALKFLDSGGSGSLSNGVAALQYAADKGARVSSNSWGCGCQSTAIEDAVKYEHDRGMVVVAAAGNSNIDALSFSPASSDQALTVAASDSNDLRASFSNWGEKIDVAAPGVQILSLKAAVSPMCGTGNTVGVNYCFVSGTSMATSHVAGLAALLLSKNPMLTNEEVRQILRRGADDLGSAGKDKDFGYGRINAFGTLNLSASVPLTPMITSPRSRTKAFGAAFQVIGSTAGSNFMSYKVEGGAGRAPTSWTTFASSTVQAVSSTVLAAINTMNLPEGNHIFRLTATDTSGKSYQFQVHDVEVDNFDAVISFPSGLVSLGSIDIVGTAQTKNGIPFGNYVLEWGLGYTPTSWSTSSIALVNGGVSPVFQAKLGTWNTSGLADKQVYSLRLTVNSSLGSNYKATSRVTADKDLIVGWPKVFINPTCFCDGSVTSADLDGDGSSELVIPAPDGKIYVYRKDGADFPGFPVSFNSGDYFEFPPNVSDLDSDGKKEILIVPKNGSGADRSYIIKYDGTAYPGWPQISLKSNGQAPTIADLNGDGIKDIVAIGAQTWTERTEVTLNAYQLNGAQLPGFPKVYVLPPVGFNPGQLFPTSYFGALSIADLDNDGSPEIAWGYSNRMYLFDNTGNILPGWPFVNPNYSGKVMLYYSAAASGDANGDGNLALFAGAVGNNCLGTGCPTQLYGWTKDGSVLPGWPKTDADGINVTWPYYATPSLTDIDADGKDEIAAGYNKLTIFDVEGIKNLLNRPNMSNQPALADFDGDGQIDLAGAWYNSLSIAKQNSSSFSTYWQRIFNNPNGTYINTPFAVADLDNNGKLELSAVTRPQVISAEGTLNLVAYLWEIPTAVGNGSYGWPMFGYDAAKTSRLALSVPPPPPPPPPDTTPPTVLIANPPSGTTYTAPGIVTIEASASDNIGVTQVEFYDGGLLKSTDPDSPYSYDWPVTVANNGTHNWTVKAFDAAGNSAESLPISLIVNIQDTTAPLVSITNPANGAIVSKRTTLTITAAASDDQGVISKLEFRVNGSLICTDTTSPYTCAWLVPGANKKYNIQVKAYDSAGNIGTTSITVKSTK